MTGKSNKHQCPTCGKVCYCFANTQNLNGYDGCNHCAINLNDLARNRPADGQGKAK